MRSLTWDQVLAWRLRRHWLVEPAPADRLVAVAGAVCGIHAQVMATAELSLGLRVAGVTRRDVRLQLWERRGLVKTLRPARDGPPVPRRGAAAVDGGAARQPAGARRGGAGRQRAAAAKLRLLRPRRLPARPGHPARLGRQGAAGRAEAVPSGRAYLAGPLPVLVLDGVVVGIWERRRSGRRFDLRVEPFVDLTASQRAAVHARGARIGEILEAPVELSFGAIQRRPHL
jgi:hypothetical protein